MAAQALGLCALLNHAELPQQDEALHYSTNSYGPRYISKSGQGPCYERTTPSQLESCPLHRHSKQEEAH